MEFYGTLGPACASAEVLSRMLDAGMTGARLNLSHMGLSEAEPWLEALFNAGRSRGLRPELLIDTQGPELRTGPLERPLIPDQFEAIATNIVSQQISGKAAETVLARLRGQLGQLTPERLLAGTDDTLRGCGLSTRKVAYLRAAAEAMTDGRLRAEELAGLPDEEAIRRLDALPGIGRWTAEMLLIFSFGRPDILSFDDLGIRRGLTRLHGIDRFPPDVRARYRALYSPYGTTASFYLWRIASER